MNSNVNVFTDELAEEEGGVAKMRDRLNELLEFTTKGSEKQVRL